MGASLRRRLSLLVGWLADLRIPGPLRRPVYAVFARLTGADPSEAQLTPAAYASLGAFFVRRLRPGARPLDPRAEALVSPCDGTLQALDEVRDGTLLQAKGLSYSASELCAGAAKEGELAGALTWTIYLGPRDYHRVHTPLAGKLVDVRWVPGDRRSVAPGVLARTPRVLATNERAVLRLETALGPVLLVMVGALNVGRIRVVGVEPGAAPPAESPPSFERGAELARFEMGSTVVLLLPRERATRLPDLALGDAVRLGRPIGGLAAGQPAAVPS